MKEVLAKVMPVSKKRTALEEAEWEDVEGDGTLERELMLQGTFMLFHQIVARNNRLMTWI